ncbi:MAG: hypothetical protein RJA44_1669 [Pseudomonadota bacterium]|jgi:hypothetical protein
MIGFAQTVVAVPRFLSLLLTAAGLWVVFPAGAATPLNKCIVNGAVTYQQGLCPATGERKQPTIEELNAAQKMRNSEQKARGFSCDGRQYCSQMRSCAEAKYFLANCPGVKMDGDGDGIPCEAQWCH